MDGNKIRLLRKDMELTIGELANITGFTASYISQIERNKIEPSLSALNKLSKALNVSLYYFLEEENDKIVITRKENRATLSPSNGVSMSFISQLSESTSIKPKFYVYQLNLKPGEWDNNNYNIVNCHKCVLVKRGTLLVEFKDFNEVLQEEDSIYLDANIPHRFYNPTSLDTDILCITSSLELP